MSPATKLTALRDHIRRLEQPVRHGVLPFGEAVIDAALSGGGLALGAVHEIAGAGGDEEDGGAAAGFIAGILARFNPFSVIPGQRAAVDPESMNTAPDPGAVGPCSWVPGSLVALAPRNDNSSKANGIGPVLWCLKRPDLYGPGLLAHGLDPARLVLVTARRDEDILWAAEEGLRTPGLTAVVGEIGRLPMAAGRRLQLAAERSGVTVLLLRRWCNATEAAAERSHPSAAVTRWRIGALPSADIAGMPGIGRPRWRVELLRVRGGVPGNWEVEVADATGHVRVSAELADRPAAPGKAKPGRIAAEPLRWTG